jgi:hypothetical protein
MIDPSFRGLVDSTGVVTGIGLSLTGYVKGDDRGSDDLRGDYLFINAIGNPESDLEWTIDGLTPGGAYALFVYGSDRNRGDWTMRVSGAADQRVSGDSGTAYFANLMADAAGTIRGSMDSLGPTGHSRGRLVRVPAPGARQVRRCAGARHAPAHRRRPRRRAHREAPPAAPVSGPGGRSERN